MAGHETLDLGMVVRIHQGQLSAAHGLSPLDTVMNPDGSNVKPIAGSFGLVGWSPDSQLWAVDSGYVNADGTDYVKVTGCPCRFAWR
jgi:hypothetical protein